MSATAPAYDTLQVDIDANGVATIALDQPETRNALSDALLQDLLDALSFTRTNDAVGCVVITSTHETTFSAGGNLGSIAADAPLLERHLASERFPAVLTALGELGKASICAANGHVLAGGLGIALACDLVIAKESATFGTPEINVGLFPFMIMALMYRNVGRKKTNELLLLGERIGADEAARIGLANRVTAADQFDSLVAEWAQRLAGKSPLLMRLGKSAMFRQQDMALRDALDFLRSQLTLASSSEDLKEGIAAFFERREPVWRGR
jgi:enoyl-CoA hydratase/carnithine racemase